MRINGLAVIAVMMMLVGMGSAQGNLEGRVAWEARESEAVADVQEERKDILLRV